MLVVGIECDTTWGLGVERLEVVNGAFVGMTARGSLIPELKVELERVGILASAQLMQYWSFYRDAREVKSDGRRQVKRCVKHVRSVVVTEIALRGDSCSPLDILLSYT